VNYIDNNLVPKVPKVSYEINIDSGMGLINFMNENKENYQRQFNTLDVIFEKKMQKRSSVFHSLPIDRT
jgi:hypothetical protein